ncbi:hypothetical protein AAEX37_01947 [Oligella sp. MSHR50489EDL]|uniref:Gp138 family membrane-puncturing spike protein n=1 Tax=Oligella sp. MSHR50489EDL TaxID=3139409 RepID=UPI003D8190DF
MQQSKDHLTSLRPEQSHGGQAELEAVINHLIGKVQTTTLVKVVAVRATGVAPVGTLDVQPLVHQIDGSGTIVNLGVVYDVPYFRLQGGANAVICDPVVGDLGICLFASRDISAVKRNKAASAPDSRRQYDWSDGLYIGGVLNGYPSQYVFFSDSGIKIVTPNGVDINAGGDVSINAGGDVNIFSSNLSHNGKNVGDSHTHSGISPGGSNTGVPN